MPRASTRGRSAAGEVLDLLAALVRAPSPNPPGDERAAMVVAHDYIASIPSIDVQQLEVAVDRPIMIATLHGDGPGPTIIFAGHIDTVPVADGWTHDPYAAEVVGNRLYGLGASDMKGGIAGFLVALRQLAARRAEWHGTVVAHVVPDEEPGGEYGTAAMLEHGLLAGDAAIVAEPSELSVYRAQKGNLFARLRVTGRSAHGSTPDLGENAIIRAAGLALDLQQGLGSRIATRHHALVGSPTINVGTIAGGRRTNMVPDECVLTVDRRTIPGESPAEAMAELEAFVGERAQVSYEHVGAAFETPADHWLVHAAAASVERVCGEPPAIGGLLGSSDARFYAAGANIPTIIVGPGAMSQAHAPDESVDVGLLGTSVGVYRELALTLLSGSTEIPCKRLEAV